MIEHSTTGHQDAQRREVERRDVIVVGGGLAGLATAATAAKAGADTLVVEVHSVGGRASIDRRDGFVFNRGGHALYVGGAGMAVLHSLGVHPTGGKPPLERYQALAGGRLHVLPTGPGSLMRTTVLGKRSKAQCARLLGSLPRLRPETMVGTSVRSWLDDLSLRTDVESVVRALIRIGTYSDDVDDFAADAAIGQLQLAARSGVIYIDGGWAQLTNGLAAGVEVRTGVKVTKVVPTAGGVEVHTAAAGVEGVEVDAPAGTFLARRVVLAPGSPAGAAALLPSRPTWDDLGPPVTAACIDCGVRGVPDPGYVLGIDEPLYATVQSPPARQSPDGQAVIAAIRYGARGASQDRAALEAHLATAGVRPDEVVTSRFLARMVVSSTLPRASQGGLPGRPDMTSTNATGVYVAGDWVGPVGLLADASLASGRAAALAAVGDVERASTLAR